MPTGGRMDQLQCSNCQDLVLANDRFCGHCGAPVPKPRRPEWPGRAETSVLDSRYVDRPRPAETSAADRRPPDRPSPAEAGQPFFGHAPRQPTERLSNTTRYLCAAAYLSPQFARRVIWELVTSHRAVVPSVHIDVGPVIRHCLHAKRIMLLRDLVLVAIVLVGLKVRSLLTLDFLLISFALGVLLPHAQWRSRGFRGKVLVALGFAATVVIVGYFSFFLVVGTFLATFLSGGGSVSAALANDLSLLITFVVFLAATWGTEYTYQHAAYQALLKRLRPGAPPFRPSSRAAEARIAAVEAAQWGNMTLYGAENPFIGTGANPKRAWSIAIELDRARPARQELLPRSSGHGYVPIDPVELHQVIRERLLRLKDPGLPPGERIAALSVDDALVGPGLLRWTSPLLDMDRKLPYSLASSEAIDSLIRHPQAGLRYYQRVSVGDEGPPVMSGGRQIIEGVDQGIAVSAFIHVAVEGRMFYIQFVMTALPPVHRDYRKIDLQPVMSPKRFQSMVAWQSFKSMFGATMYSPSGIYSALRQWRKNKQFQAEFTPSDGSVVGDFGAQVSVRELGAQDDFSSHMQRLDLEKYNRIIERLLMDTVLDFLDSKGVDISAFASSASTIINGNVVSANTISGGQWSLGGQGNVFHQSRADT